MKALVLLWAAGGTSWPKRVPRIPGPRGTTEAVDAPPCPSREHLDVAALDVLAKVVDRLLDGVQMRVDGKGLLEGLIGALLVAGLAQDHAEPGPGAEMARLALQRLRDVGHRVRIVVLQEIQASRACSRPR